jgi:hypothetical protein
MVWRPTETIQTGSTSDGVIDFLTSLKQVAERELIFDSGVANQ